MLIKHDCQFVAYAAQWNKTHCAVKDLKKYIFKNQMQMVTQARDIL